MIIKKKYISIGAVVALMVVGIIVNTSYKRSDGEIVSAVNDSENNEIDNGEAIFVNETIDDNTFNINARNDREVVRSKALDILNNTLKYMIKWDSS